MKKILILCFAMFGFVATDALAAKCLDYGVAREEWLLEFDDDGGEYSECKLDKLDDEVDVRWCANPQKAPGAGREKTAPGGDGRVVWVANSVYKSTATKGNGWVLNAGRKDASNVCMFCPTGFHYDSAKQRCIEVHEQKCTYFVGAKCKAKESYLTEYGTHGCYICDQREDGSCSNGNRVFMREGALGGDAQTKKNHVWVCRADLKKWVAEPIKPCAGNSDLSADYQAGRALAPVIRNTNRNVSHNNASSFVVTGGELCIEWKCNADKGYKERDGKCVQDSDYSAYCTQNGGEYVDGKCECKDILGLEPADSNRTCKCKGGSDYNWDAAQRKCVLSQAAQNRNRAAANAKQKCQNSGGQYKGGKCVCDAAKNLRTEAGACVCTDNNYVRNGDKCDLTDEAAYRQLCESADAKATGAYWDVALKSCKCTDAQKLFIDGKCIQDPELTAKINACKEIPGAVWRANECVCEDSDMEIKDGQCVETEEARKRRESAALSVKITTAKRRIDAAMTNLNNITSGLETSVWKNAEGKFNTARLASDSIAGVVLGTAGGLITSSVMKKAQIEDGFEDINCTIGGQTVAGWGDEFQVGIR